MTIKPKRLQPGDTIGIVAPSSYISDENASWLDKSVEVLDSYGLKVKVGNNFRRKDKYNPVVASAGTPEERASDLCEMFTNPDIKAIWCYQGGKTVNEILPLLNYDFIREHPKIFIGM